MKMREEYAVVLDFLEHGHAEVRQMPIAQVIGENHLTLLEVVVKEGIHLKTEDRIYIGEGQRDQIKYIKGRISLNDLSGSAKSEVDFILEKLIERNESRFVKFFNEAEPLTTRM